MKPITYPARPANGGRFDLMGDAPYGFFGKWYAEPKINDWRLLLYNGEHPPEAWNRKLEPFANVDKFTDAIQFIHRTIPRSWVDCCAMGLRTPVGKGCIAVLDVFESSWNYDPTGGERYGARREWLESRLPTLNIEAIAATRFHDGNVVMPPVFILPKYDMDQWGYLWNEVLPAVNKALNCELFEGMVMKDADGPYPIQLRSDDKKTPLWVKSRWRY